MTWIVIKKEFLGNLLTYRFAFSFVACSLLMGVSAYVLAQNYEKRVEAYKAEKIQAQANLGQIKIYGQLRLFATRPPSPLSVFSEGLENRLGNVLYYSTARVPTMANWQRETNPLLDAFPAFDLAMIAQLFFSLMALFFAYDAVSAEREAGTLRLILTNSVARYQVLMGKWVGGMLCTALPAFAGLLIALLILFNSAQVDLTSDEWLRVGSMIAIMLTYLSVFYWIGLFISIRVEHSTTALISAILVWALTTIIAPTCTTYLVGELSELPSEQDLRLERAKKIEEFYNEYESLLSPIKEEAKRKFGFDFFALGGEWDSFDIGPYWKTNRPYKETTPLLQKFFGKIEPRRMQYAQYIAQLEERVVSARLDQAKLATKLGRLFLTPGFSNALTILAGTDLAAYQDFVQHAQNCRRNLVGHMWDYNIFISTLFFSTTPEKELLNKDETFKWKKENSYQEWKKSEKSLDLSPLPQCPDYRLRSADWMARVSSDLIVLLAAHLIFMLLSIRGFLRRDLI